jgi:hypothetical protein
MQRAFWPDTASVSAHSPSEVARSLPPECVEKGLNGAGECVVSEIDLVMSYVRASGSDDGREGKAAKKGRSLVQ